MIAKGTYRARATGHEFGVTAKDNDYIAVTYELTSDGPHKGDSITGRLYFSTDKNTQRSLESLKYAGWTGQDLESLPGLGSCECELVIGHELYEGETYARVQWVNQIGRGGGVSAGEQMNTAQKSAFAARLRGNIAAVNLPKGGPAPAPAKATGTDDDIPF